MSREKVRTSRWSPRSAFLVFLAAICLAGLAALLMYRPQGERTADVLSSPVAGFGGAFSLRDQFDRPFTEQQLLGKPTLLFFGYTYCPDICPTTLIDAKDWFDKLGPDAGRLRLVFVTVDPARDTPEKLASYLSDFDPRFIGLTGSQAEVDRIVKAYRVVARKVQGTNGDYTMDHTAGVYLLNSKSQLVGVLGYQEAVDKVMPKLRKLISLN